jgi:hypothetical protein
MVGTSARDGLNTGNIVHVHRRVRATENKIAGKSGKWLEALDGQVLVVESWIFQKEFLCLSSGQYFLGGT